MVEYTQEEQRRITIEGKMDSRLSHVDSIMLSIYVAHAKGRWYQGFFAEAQERRAVNQVCRILGGDPCTDHAELSLT